jgi:hypothetical protein
MPGAWIVQQDARPSTALLQPEVDPSVDQPRETFGAL